MSLFLSKSMIYFIFIKVQTFIVVRSLCTCKVYVASIKYLYAKKSRQRKRRDISLSKKGTKRERYGLFGFQDVRHGVQMELFVVRKEEFSSQVHNLTGPCVY